MFEDAVGVLSLLVLVLLPLTVIKGPDWLKKHDRALGWTLAALLMGSIGAIVFLPGWLDERDLRDAVRNRLYDPDSAKFRNVRRAGSFYCGEVNAKNKMGGYVGFNAFRGMAPVGPSGEWHIYIDDDDSNVAFKMCSREAEE